MKLKDILSQYTADTKKASDICRQINYSLIAVCWILAKESVDSLSKYEWILYLIVLSLYLDFFQYFLRGIWEEKHYKKQEGKAKDDKGVINEDYEAKPYPIYIRQNSIVLYYSKIACTLMAFLLLFWRIIVY